MRYFEITVGLHHIHSLHYEVHMHALSGLLWIISIGSIISIGNCSLATNQSFFHAFFTFCSVSEFDASSYLEAGIFFCKSRVLILHVSNNRSFTIQKRLTSESAISTASNKTKAKKNFILSKMLLSL